MSDVNELKLLENIRQIVETKNIDQIHLAYVKLQVAKLEASLRNRISNVIKLRVSP